MNIDLLLHLAFCLGIVTVLVSLVFWNTSNYFSREIRWGMFVGVAISMLTTFILMILWLCLFLWKCLL